MEGNLIGVFGSGSDAKTSFLGSIAKKSETEGIIVYQRNDSGRKYSFLDDASYPERVQGYSRIASLADSAFYFFPQEGRLSSADGEIAILLDSFNLEGRIEVIDGSKSTAEEVIKKSFRGLKPSSYAIEERDSKSTIIDLSTVTPRKDYPKDRTLVYIDRSFNVKGVGLVVLGFVLCGKISVHDKLRMLPGDSSKLAEVKGIQISDEDYDSTDRGIRIGLSLKGVELKDLAKVSWLDDGGFKTSTEIRFRYRQSTYYKQPTFDRDLHVEANGELLVSRIVKGNSDEERIAKLASGIPVWENMPIAVLDLNSKPLRVTGGGTVNSTY